MAIKNTYIQAKSQEFKFSNIKNQIEQIADSFSIYLDGFQSKLRSTSKHAVMGPVGKILEKVKTSEWNKNDLLGYAIRIHEMTNESGSYLKTESMEGLENGVENILELLNQVPLGVKTKVIEHIGHAIYYKRRKQEVEYFESVKQEFITYLQNKYETKEELSQSWGESVEFEDILYPSKNQFKKASGNKAEDIKYFRENIISSN